MKRYTIQCSAKSVVGWQTFEVVANNEAEAIEKFNRGECECVQQELEVQRLGEPEIIAIDDEKPAKKPRAKKGSK